MRIPRKKKKAFKKIWFKRQGIKVLIIKKTIDYKEWECSFGNVVYGCITRHKKL